MVVLSVSGALRMVARFGLEFSSILRRLALGNLTGSFRQSASVLGLFGCAAAQPAPATPPISGSERATTVKNGSEPAGEKPVRNFPHEAPKGASLPTNLAVAGFEPSVLRLSPLRRPAPLFVIAHGAGDQVGRHCRHYEAMLGPSAALLCLTGKRMVTRDLTRGYYYPDHIELAEELIAARAAIRETHAAALSGDSDVYIGYSQGATMGVLAIAGYGKFFARLALVEGGFDSWSSVLARKYKNGGGQRVLFVCGTEHCRNHTAKAVAILSKAGLEVKALYAAHAGHRPDGPVATRVREGLPWLLDGDPLYDEVLSHVSQLPGNIGDN